MINELFLNHSQPISDDSLSLVTSSELVDITSNDQMCWLVSAGSLIQWEVCWG